MGQPVSNSFRYFTPAGGTRTGVAFAYWTAPLFDPAGPPFPPAGQTDLTPEMINENGKIAPAPWVPYTRAGCDFGAVATANTILENTAIDVPTVYGANSPEAIQVAGDSPGASATQSFADFVGIGIHCAKVSTVCTDANHARPDLLPDEPGAGSDPGYTGYKGIFGAKYVDPAIAAPVMKDLDGNTIRIQNGHVGFPGFDGMEATVSLSWVAQMQEHGVPVTFAYISDAHDGHGTAGNIHFAYGPGEAGYKQQLQAYDSAFQKFFDRLAADGINKSNTLFVFTVDEGDHFVGDAPTPAGCDGVSTPCNYNRVGEINADLRRMIRTQFGDTTAFTVHSDDAPTVYVDGTPATPIRPRTDPLVRTLERESARLQWTNPYTGQVQAYNPNDPTKNITQALADPVEEQALHMVTADPNRTPTYTLFADPDWFFFATGGPVCALQSDCALIPARTSQSFAWNHGDIQEEIATTWVGYVGPGIEHKKVVDDIWTDHTDVRPTMLTALGLKDDYAHDGVATVDILKSDALPKSLQEHRGTLTKLDGVLKQLDAPFGQFGVDSLIISTRALASNSPGDATYTQLENQLLGYIGRRDALVAQIIAAVEADEFAGQVLNQNSANDWVRQGNALLSEVHAASS